MKVNKYDLVLLLIIIVINAISFFAAYNFMMPSVYAILSLVAALAAYVYNAGVVNSVKFEQKNVDKLYFALLFWYSFLTIAVSNVFLTLGFSIWDYYNSTLQDTILMANKMLDKDIVEDTLRTSVVYSLYGLGFVLNVITLFYVRFIIRKNSNFHLLQS